MFGFGIILKKLWFFEISTSISESKEYELNYKIADLIVAKLKDIVEALHRWLLVSYNHLT
jgi:hypothetical protein